MPRRFTGRPIRANKAAVCGTARTTLARARQTSGSAANSVSPKARAGVSPIPRPRAFGFFDVLARTTGIGRSAASRTAAVASFQAESATGSASASSSASCAARTSAGEMNHVSRQAAHRTERPSMPTLPASISYALAQLGQTISIRTILASIGRTGAGQGIRLRKCR